MAQQDKCKNNYHTSNFDCHYNQLVGYFKNMLVNILIYLIIWMIGMQLIIHFEFFTFIYTYRITFHNKSDLFRNIGIIF